MLRLILANELSSAWKTGPVSGNMFKIPPTEKFAFLVHYPAPCISTVIHTSVLHSLAEDAALS